MFFSFAALSLACVREKSKNKKNTPSPVPLVLGKVALFAPPGVAHLDGAVVERDGDDGVGLGHPGEVAVGPVFFFFERKKGR